MKHTNKKGFTIVELVIVIAVIAILAAVLIPNLSRLVTKADKSAAMQEAKAAMDNDLINAEGALENMSNLTVTDDTTKQYFIVSSYTVAKDGEIKANSYTSTDGKSFTKVTVETSAAEGTYYILEAYNGTYNKGTETYTIEKGGFTCTFANGAWTVEK